MTQTEQKLDIQTYVDRDMGWGYVDGMRVLFPSYMTIKETMKEKELLNKIAKYCANKIGFWLLTDADSFIKKYQEKYPIDTKEDAVYLSYGDGKTALVYPSMYQNQIDVNPYIQFNIASHFGFTLTPGHFSDFHISELSTQDGLFGYTKDFLGIHFPVATEYLEMYCQLYQEILHEMNTPDDFEKVSHTNYLLLHEDVAKVKNQIRKKIEELTSTNQSKRIDSLKIGNENLFTLLHEYNVRYMLRLHGVRLFNIAIRLGKPPKQIDDYLERLQRRQYEKKSKTKTK